MRIDKKNIIQILTGLQWSSAVAAVVTGVLLAATLIQTQINDPIVNSDFSNVRQLIERNRSDQTLKDEVRALDMLARKAYFTSMRQLKSGTILFFAALAFFLITWNIRTALSPIQPKRPARKVLWWERQTRNAKTTAFVGTAAIIIVISLGIIHKYELASALLSKRNAALDEGEFSRWWMNFRGAGGVGVAASANVPMKFDGASMSGIRWKTEVPLEGHSSPVVYGDKIFLTGANKESRKIFCFNLDDGELIWAYDVKVPGFDASNVPKVDRETGYAAPTAACDGKNVYAIFATGELAALTLKGKLVWSKYWGTPDNHYGHSSSLITHDGLLFVQLDEYDKGKLIAVEGKSGKAVWEAPRTILSWGSPIIVNSGNRRELILVDNEYVSSYDPLTGKLLWNRDCLQGEVGPSAAYASGKVFSANEYAVAAGIDLTNTDEEGKPPLLWKVRGDLPNAASPVSVDTLLFLTASNGVVTCLDNRTGTTLWTHTFETGFYSSPIVAGNNVYLFDRDGTLHVFAAASEFTLIESSSLGEPVTATPAMLDGYMIVRGKKFLYRIE